MVDDAVNINDDQKSKSENDSVEVLKDANGKPKYGAMLADFPGYDPYKEIEQYKKERKLKKIAREKEMRRVLKERLKADIKEKK